MHFELNEPSDIIQTDILDCIKAVSKRDFEKELKSGKIQILVPQVFLSKFPHVYMYNEFIQKINELK